MNDTFYWLVTGRYIDGQPTPERLRDLTWSRRRTSTTACLLNVLCVGFHLAVMVSCALMDCGWLFLVAYGALVFNLHAVFVTWDDYRLELLAGLLEEVVGC